MALYERILVTLDGSSVDDALLDDIEHLAEALGATVLLLRVAHFHTRDSRAAEEDEARADLARAAARLGGHGFAVETVLGRGEPAEVIVAQAESGRRRADRHGRPTGTAGSNAACSAASPTTCATTATCRCWW